MSTPAKESIDLIPNRGEVRDACSLFVRPEKNHLSGGIR
jgi:hypothetical protein